MILIKEDKTNWKYIWIVVILALFVVGGILWCATKLDDLFTRLPEIKKSEGETANWKTYRNEAYGYTIKYPKEWLVEIATDWDVAKADSVSWHPQDRMQIVVENKAEYATEDWARGNVEPYEYIGGGDVEFAEYKKSGEVDIEGQKITILKSKWGHKFVSIPRNEYVYVIGVTKEINAELLFSTFKFIEIKEEYQRYRHFPILIPPNCTVAGIPRELEDILKKRDAELDGWGYSVCTLDLDENESTQEYVARFNLKSAIGYAHSIYQKINGKWKAILFGPAIFYIEKEKTSGYHNILTLGHSSARVSYITRYKFSSTNASYMEDTEWGNTWGHYWESSNQELRKVIRDEFQLWEDL